MGVLGELRVVVALLAVLAQGCASASKVPSISPEELPGVSLQAVSPRNILIEVKNNREANRKAGNSAEVEKAVAEAVGAVLARGGLTVKGDSPNLMSLLIEDYVNPEADGSCVKITGKLKVRWGSSISAGVDACHSMQRENGFALAGDISESYTLALKVILESFEKNQVDLLRAGKL